MTANNIGVTYGSLSGIIRAIIDPNDDAELAAAQLPSGHSVAMLIIAKSDAPTMADIQAAVALAIGKPVPSGRTAVVTNGIVTAIIQADPLLDFIAGSTLVASDTAVVGDTIP